MILISTQTKRVSESRDWDTFLQAAQEVEADYNRELEINCKLTAELECLRAENRSLQSQINELKKQVASLSSDGSSSIALSEIQNQVNASLKKLREEAEKLKTTYPIFNLLAAKQIEIERLSQSLVQIGPTHPDRETIESMIRAHLAERDELKKIAEEAEVRLQKQLDQIHSSYLNFSRKVTDASRTLSSPSKKGRSECGRIPED